MQEMVDDCEEDLVYYVTDLLSDATCEEKMSEFDWKVPENIVHFNKNQSDIFLDAGRVNNPSNGYLEKGMGLLKSAFEFIRKPFSSSN